jgi:hypothetical protein
MMDFWIHFLDLTKNRKTKLLILGTVIFLMTDKLSGDQWVMLGGLYIAGAASEKIAKMKFNK